MSHPNPFAGDSGLYLDNDDDIDEAIIRSLN